MPLQSLVLAPLFVWLELLFWCGYRPELQAELKTAIDANIAAHLAGGESDQKAPLLAPAERAAADGTAADQ